MLQTGRQYWERARRGRLIDRSVMRVLFCCACSGATVSAQAETRAGTRIVNTAAAQYDIGAGAQTARSNDDVIMVAERLDIALSWDDAPRSSTIPFLLTNRGNGMEAFRLSAAVATGTVPARFAIDRDGDGRYNPARDAPLADAITPQLEPGASLALLLIENDTTVDMAIVAEAVTGFGDTGTVFAGAGDGGGDAVVGPTGARAVLTAPGALETEAPTLTKTQSVLAPDGSARAVRGATISYTLVARFAEATTSAQIDDPLPPDTIYLRGSLSLDGVPLSDAGTTDRITVPLGDIAEPGTRTLQFKVRIQ